MVTSPTNFFSLFSRKILLFSKTLLDEKIFKTLFPMKKGCIHLRRQTLTSLQKGLDPQKQFVALLSRTTTFLKKTVK